MNGPMPARLASDPRGPQGRSMMTVTRHLPSKARAAGRAALLSAALCALLAGILPPGGSPALAQDGARYALERTGSGFIRLDRQTGAISFCIEEGGNLVCRMAVDDRAAFETDILALEKRVEALEKRLADGSPAMNAPARDSEEEFATSLDRMEQFFRRFMGIVKEFSGESGEATPGAEPQPDRT